MSKRITDFTDLLLLDAIYTVLRKRMLRSRMAVVVQNRGDVVLFESTRGALYVAPTVECPTLVGFRSLLKVKKRGPRATWLSNGQAGDNTKVVVFYGEYNALRLD